MKKITLLLSMVFLLNHSYAQNSITLNSIDSVVNFDSYENLVHTVKSHRASRLIKLDSFLKFSKDSNVVILDTRSDSMFKLLHIKGAINIDFSDFTQARLEELIPNKNTKILIYCNNNFIDRTIFKFRPFVTKMSSPIDFESITLNPLDTQSTTVRKRIPKTQPVPITLALNIPTYINLYGYGYKNVYELHELIDPIKVLNIFEGSAHPYLVFKN